MCEWVLTQAYYSILAVATCAETRCFNAHKHIVQDLPHEHNQYKANNHHSYDFVDLRKFRSYHGSSVRDLLRAMRNKVSVNLYYF